MRQEFQYRQHTVWHDGDAYVAEPTASDDHVFEMSCVGLEPLLQAIDQLEDSLALPGPEIASATPKWFTSWLERGCNGRVLIPERRLVDWTEYQDDLLIYLNACEHVVPRILYTSGHHS